MSIISEAVEERIEELTIELKRREAELTALRTAYDEQSAALQAACMRVRELEAELREYQL